MFCTNCGEEIQCDWKVCPNCGELVDPSEKVNKGNVNASEELEVEDKNLKTREDITNEKAEAKHSFQQSDSTESDRGDFTVGKTKITGRFLLKIFALIAIVCFFCPLYMVSCAGKEVISVSGLDLVRGFSVMGEETDGNLIWICLLLLPVVSLCSAFINRTKIEENEKWETLKYNSYINAICSGAVILIVWFLTTTIVDHSKGTALEITLLLALKMFVCVNIVSLIIGIYLAYLAEQKKKKNVSKQKELVKTIGKAIGGSILCFVVVLLPFAKDFSPSTNSDDYVEDYTVVEDEKDAEAVKDYSEIDLEDVFGDDKSEEKLKKIGFEGDDELEEYTLLDGDVYVSCTEGRADTIKLTGTGDNMPSIHGVKIGMNIEEAESLLKDTYTPIGKMDDQTAYHNEKSGFDIVLEVEDVNIIEITAMQLSKEELQEYVEETYIFPDSDKRYLSEEEVRSAGVDKMVLGRNEIFARHGRIFNDASIAEYFKSQSWYNGTIPAEQFNSDSTLNDFEKKNVELIKKVENEVSGTSNTSEPFIGMNGTYQCGSSPESGVIDVYVIDEQNINIAIGTHAQQGILGGTGGGMPGTITSSNTAVVDWGSCIFTLTWSEIGKFQITIEGSSGISEIDTITNGVDYVNSSYYHTS